MKKRKNKNIPDHVYVILCKIIFYGCFAACWVGLILGWILGYE